MSIKDSRALSGVAFAGLALVLSGCGGGGGTSAVLNGGNPLINVSSFTGTYDSSTVSQFLANQEFQNVARYSRTGTATSSSLHPYVLTNIHEAYGYGLSGAGAKIAILDTGFNTPSQVNTGLASSAFVETLAKRDKIQFLGTIRDATGDPFTGGQTPNHGAIVASIAAASFDGSRADDKKGSSFYSSYYGSQYPFRSFSDLDHGMMGVAFNADLVISDYISVNGSLTGMAQLTNGLASTGANVINNSWGQTHPSTGDLLTLPANIPADISSYSTRQASDWLWTNTGQAFSVNNWISYHDSLENFQRNGVVVFALQNSNDSQPSLMASLPSIYPNLKGAWIAVGSIDTRGSTRATMSVSTPLSAPCGRAAEYCVVVDGQELTGSGIVSSRGYSPGLSGASLAAPQVSGMIALLAQAFQGQNLTPSDLAARLLATSYNRFSGFTRSGTRDFGNGVEHDYSSTFGHGIPDMLAALQPVVTNTAPLSFISSGTPLNGTRLPVTRSGIVTGEPFGDALTLGLSAHQALSFDALGAGFPVALDRLSHQRPYKKSLGASFLPKAVYENQFAVRAGSQEHGLGSFVLARGLSLQKLSQELSTRSTPEPDLSWQSLNLPSTGPMSEAVQATMGFQSNDLHWFGYTSSSRAQERGLNNKLARSPEPIDPNVMGVSVFKRFEGSENASFVAIDYRHEFDAVKGSESQGAMRIGESLQVVSLTPGFQMQAGQWNFSAIASVSINRIEGHDDDRSLLSLSGPFVSTGALIKVTRQNMLDNRDSAYLQVWQPERIEKASVRLKVPQASGLTSPIRYNTVVETIHPSGREVGLGVGYSWRAGKATRAALEVSVVSDPGHQQETNQDVAARFNWIVNF